MPAGLFLIALLPPPLLREQVRALKEEMRSRFGSGHALKSPAHITLQMPFRLSPEDEGVLFGALERFAAAQIPFQVDLAGFDCFAPRVLFIRVRDQGPVCHLQSALQAALAREDSLGLPGEERPFHPHMTIATRDLEEPAFYRAWADFQDRPYQASFEVSGLFLLKHNGRSWDVYREFRFGESS